MLSKVDLCGLTVVGIALAIVLASTSWVLMPTDVGRPSFPYNGACSPHRLGTVPSGSDVVLES